MQAVKGVIESVMSFSVGDIFSSYNDLESKSLKRLKTLEAAAKIPKKVEKANKELVYYTINLTVYLVGKSTKIEEQV